MKHIQLFEQFNPGAGMPAQSFEGLIFDWMPFDAQSENPIQSSMPEKLTFEELKAFVSEGKDLEAVKEAGLYMAHKKNSDGGFTRFIAKDLSPLTFEMSTFDKNYEKTSEIENVNPEEVDLGNLAKGSSILSRYGKMDFKG